MFSIFDAPDNRDYIDAYEIDDVEGIIIDVREPIEYREGHIKDSINIPMDIIMTSPEKFMDKDTKYYIICRSAKRSKTVCDFLNAQGYNLVNIEGGIIDYEGDKLIR